MAAGEVFAICNSGRLMVRITAGSALPQRRRLGLLEGHCEVPDDFDRMAAGTIADLFEGAKAGS